MARISISQRVKHAFSVEPRELALGGVIESISPPKAGDSIRKAITRFAGLVLVDQM